MAKTTENTTEIMDVAVEEGAEVTKAAADAVSDVAEVVDDYKITAGDVAILGFAAVGVGTAAYALYKGGKKVYEHFKRKNEEKRWNEINEELKENEQVEEIYDEEVAEDFDKQDTHSNTEEE